ncbi:hypothetical protein ACFSO7_20845 [Bacillus sp. CGMCC 1.16607]
MRIKPKQWLALTVQDRLIAIYVASKQKIRPVRQHRSQRKTFN